MKRFTTSELVSYLRVAVEVQAEDTDVSDTGYLAMSDAQLEEFIKVAATNSFSKYPLDKIPEDAIYPIILLAQRGLYFKLATIAAPLYNLQADGASLSRTQIFEHYMALIKQIDSEYQDYESNGGSTGTLTSYNVQLANRRYTRYNQLTALPPAIVFYIDSVADTSVEVSWDCEHCENDFLNYRVYLSTTGSVFDEYDTETNISKDAKMVIKITDIWQRKCRIKGFAPNTTYYVGVVACANGAKKGYDSDSFTTKEVTTAEVDLGEGS